MDDKKLRKYKKLITDKFFPVFKKLYQNEDPELLKLIEDEERVAKELETDLDLWTIECHLEDLERDEKMLRENFIWNFKTKKNDLKFIGATILDIGLSVACKEGGLAIEYLVEGDSKPKRLIFGFTELGAWVELAGDKIESNSIDFLKGEKNDKRCKRDY